MRPCATSLASEMTEEELSHLSDYLKKAAYTGAHLEIGTAAGGTLCELMGNYEDASRPQFVVVDPMAYFPNQFDLVKENLRNHDLSPEGIDFQIATSAEAFAALEAEGRRFDFILIDGNHKIRYVTEDLRWARLLNPGGLLCMHDYNLRFPGVTVPANRFLKKHSNYHKLKVVGDLLFIEKKAESQQSEIPWFETLRATLLSPYYQLKLSVDKRLRKLKAV